MEIRFEGISLEFARPSGEPLPVLRDVTFAIPAGRFCGIVGPSGCGKSTLLGVISGLVRPQGGTAYVDTTPVTGINPRLGYMFQRDTLLPWATALENVRVPLEVQGRRDDVRALELLARFGLAQFTDYYPHQLSGGMRKRVQLARLLAQDPDVLLMDEPFAALDAQTRLLVTEEFLGAWEGSGKTVLFVTHDLTEAIGLSDVVVVLSARPAAVKREVSVPLPRPRDLVKVSVDRAFAGLYQDIWALLKVEVVRARTEP